LIVIDHYKNHHADRHPTIGCITALATTCITAMIGSPLWVSILAFSLSGLIYGMLIEIGQRIVRNNGQQNTLRESLLDIAVTACWPMFLYEDVVLR